MVSLEALPLPMTRWIWFPMALTPIRASHRSESSNLIYAIRWKRNLEAAQTRASNKDITFFRLGNGRASRSKVYFIVSLGVYASAAPFYCSPRTSLID